MKNSMIFVNTCPETMGVYESKMKSFINSYLIHPVHDQYTNKFLYGFKKVSLNC